jgi:hypothetical protein
LVEERWKTISRIGEPLRKAGNLPYDEVLLINDQGKQRRAA